MIANTDRNKEIVLLHDSGISFTSLGIRYGISRSRVEQIYKRESLKEKSRCARLDKKGFDYYIFLAAKDLGLKEPMLPTKVIKCLLRAGIIQQIEDGYTTLDDYPDDILMDIRNFGIKSLELARRANDIYKASLTTIE